MQSRELPQQPDGTPGPTASHALRSGAASEAADFGDLSAAVLLRLLIARIVAALGAQRARLAQAFVRARSRLGHRKRLHSAAAAPAPATAPAIGTADLSRDGPRHSFAGWRHRRAAAWLGFAALLPAAYVAYCIVTIPFAGGLAAQPSPGALVVRDEYDRPLATRGIFKGEPIAPDQIPPTLASAVTSIEDRRFYQHDGVDLRATIRAAWHDLIGRKIEGGSTITQQLARRLYLTPERSLKRKVQEACLALWLEARFSKQQILARYLDSAYFGDGAYGVDAAAKRYFGKSAAQLSLSEAAMLAGLIRAPSELEPDRNLAGAKGRADLVLTAMVETGAITPQQADAARQKPAVLHAPAEASPGSNYFIDTAAAEVKALTGSNAEDLTVRTTLNPQLQQIAESVIGKRLAAVGKAKNIHQAALVAMAPDGAILAMVGGRDYNESQFNRVTQARRQPGSLFKAFVYLAALRKGYTPDSTIVDQPINVGDWEPDNYGDRYYGPVTLRTAFAHSLNSVAVQLAQAVGIPAVIATAKQLGVRSDLPAVPSVALGSGSVTLLEMTRAFAAMATDTGSVDGYTVRDISKADQTVYRRAAPALAAADNPAIHAEMLDLFSSVPREGTATAARLDRPVGGKTGTSQDYHDAWFVGFTSDLVVGVWVGNDDNAPMNGVTGGSVPASIWHDFVAAAETVRHPQAAPFNATAEATPSAPVISFAGVGAVNANAAERSRYTNDNGWRQPFRLFWFPRF
jgi:penicillin-binding protein 1A